MRKLLVDRVAQKNLQVVENLEEGSRSLGIPVVEGNRSVVVAVARFEISPETRLPQPSNDLVRAHADAPSRGVRRETGC
jgi:hypothetical protein